MWNDHTVLAIQIVHDFHVKSRCTVDLVLNPFELLYRRLDEHELRAEIWFIEPVSAWHRDRRRRKQEELVHRL